MCDESMHAKRSKRAVTGDKLTTHTFHEAHGGVAGIKGNQTDTAICLLPGAKLSISNVPDALRQKYNLPPTFEAIFAERVVGFDFEDMMRSCVIAKNNFGLPVMFKMRELGDGAHMKVASMVAEPASEFCEIDLAQFNLSPPMDLFADFPIEADDTQTRAKVPDLVEGDD